MKPYGTYDTALVTRLKELEDPQKEAVPSFADTDWRTLSGVVAREIESLRQRNDDLVTGLEACDEQVVALRQQLAAALAAIKVKDAFIEKVAKQTPEKPDYWSSCSQCGYNSSEAEDLLAIQPDDSALQAFAEKVRDQCARIIEAQDVDPSFKHRMADAIRTRGNRK